jgi:dolichyl-phosphate beta-glucosyltransferase
MFLSVVIPAYNEGKRIPATLQSLKEYFKDKDYEYEILVVVDGAKDNTAQVVKDANIPNLKLIDNKKNCGKGCVVKQGMLEAKGKYRLFMDADNATTIDHVEKLLPYFDKDYDVVIASVGVKGAEIVNSEKFYKRVFGLGSNLIIQIVLVPGIKDTQRGFKIFTAKAAEDIFKRLTLDRWGFDFEALAVARKLGYKIKEVPIRWKNDPKSLVTLSAYIKTFVELIRVRINLWKGVYK